MRGPVQRLLQDYAWPHRWSFFAGAVCLWVTNYLTVSIPGEIGAAIDVVHGGGSPSGHAASVAIMGLVIIGVRTLSRVLIFNPGRDIEYQIRQDLFGRLLIQQPEFYAKRLTGDIVSRASNDISWTRTMVGFGLLQMINVAMAVPLASWKMFQLSPKLSALTLLPVVVGLIIVQWAIHHAFPLMRKNQEELSAISAHALDSFQGITTIQSFSARKAFSERFAEHNNRWFRTGMKLALLRSIAFPLLMFAGGLSVVILIRVGADLTATNELTVGDIAAFGTLLAALLPPLRSMGFMLSVWHRGRASLERILELMDAPISRPEGETPSPMVSGRGPSIQFRDLSFAYPDALDKPVLNGISVDIKAGETIGIFGQTGCGKTTLLQLIARLYNPPESSVQVDGTDIRFLDLKEWRQRLAVVPQRPFLFSDTIAANISLQDVPDPKRVEEAAQLAALTADLKALPDGLNTVVGERGIMLSGGQRQRVALARGLFRKADVILLDDVLSAVDHENEARLIRTLANLASGDRRPTTILVSNRLSTFEYADRIIVMANGSIVDQGPHDALISRPGLYQDTWRVQQEEEAQ